MNLFDTHAHYYDERFNEDRHELLESLASKDVDLVVSPGTDPETSEFMVDLCNKYSFLYTAAGYHPHEASTATDEGFERIEKLLTLEKVVAVGEVGLDYYYDHSPRDVQKKVLVRQLELARKYSLPVILHDREAHADCLDIIKGFPDVMGVYHSYSGSWQYAKEVLALGWYLSFTGSITFKNAYKVHETVVHMPEDRIMIETDAPYLTPTPHRGKRNDSSYVKLVCEKVAELRGIPVEEAAELTTANGKRFFGIGEV